MAKVMACHFLDYVTWFKTQSHDWRKSLYCWPGRRKQVGEVPVTRNHRPLLGPEGSLQPTTSKKLGLSHTAARKLILLTTQMSLFYSTVIGLFVFCLSVETTNTTNHSHHFQKVQLNVSSWSGPRALALLGLLLDPEDKVFCFHSLFCDWYD